MIMRQLGIRAGACADILAFACEVRMLLCVYFGHDILLSRDVPFISCNEQWRS